MKSSKNRSSTSNYHSKIDIVIKKEQQMQQEASQKYEKFKKSASLPSYFINKARLRKIAQIYQTLSVDKLKQGHSKGKRNSQLCSPQKKKTLNGNPYSTINLNTFCESNHNKTKRLILSTEQSYSKTFTNNLTLNTNNNANTIRMFKNINQKLEEITAIKIDKFFSSEYEGFMRLVKDSNLKENKNDQIKEYLAKCLNLIQECERRKWTLKEKQTKKNYAQLEEQYSILTVELKKKSIKMLLKNKEVQKLEEQVKSMKDQIEQLKKNQKVFVELRDACINTTKDNTCINKMINSDGRSIFIQTQINSSHSSTTQILKEKASEDNDVHCKDENLNAKLKKYINRIHQYEIRQKQLLSVLVVLKKEGIDIQRIFQEVVSGKLNEEDNYEQDLKENLEKIENENAKIYEKCKRYKNNNSFDADDSILSSAKALSFNYQEKSDEEEAYTIRHEYKCKNTVQGELKQKLKLNFDRLFEEKSFSEDGEYQQDFDAPTV